MSSHNAPRYNAFLSNLSSVKSLIIVKEVSGIKYFKWLTILELRALLGI